MRLHRLVAALAAVFPLVAVWAEEAPPAPPVKSLGVVTVDGGRPSSLPTQIPASMEGMDAGQIAQAINATDSEDALKYLPSLLVRKRYIGDYNHAVLSSRASGTGNSARSAVYADGVLLSNFLGNGINGVNFPPRWGLVTPEEIERVDVMYGPFSAAYPGNSVGAVVDYVTRMPTRFEAHAKLGLVAQPFDLYNTHETYRAWQASASMGDKAGAWSWWVNANHTDSHGQPLTFATRLLGTGTPGGTGTVVSGAVLERNNANAPWYILGTGTEYRTRQDHLKVKLAYDFSPTVRASYVLGVWQNTADNDPRSYLRDGAGNGVASGAVSVGGQTFAALTGADFTASRENLKHTLHGLSVKSSTRGRFDWEVAASLYDYGSDLKRANAAGNPLPGASSGGPGTLTDASGTGWNNLALKGIWRPDGMQGAHVLDFGYQQDSYRYRFANFNLAGNWLTDAAGALANEVGGHTQLHSLYAQDAWAFAPGWKAVLGLRLEEWRASDGFTTFGLGNAANARYAARGDSFASPKAALSWAPAEDWVLKAATGRAVRFPTVAELYGATSTTNAQYINDPNLKPEQSWTGELTAEKDLGNATLRLTYFAENTRDALYSQTVQDAVANRNVSRVQNVGYIQTRGVELVYNGSDVVWKGFDLQGSLTWADSPITQNAGFVAVPGDTLGKQQPNIPHWRGSLLASYRLDAQWSLSLGARYSGTQYRTLNNADVNGATYMGVSPYFTVDVRARYVINAQWSAALGIDNLNNCKFWNFHPYPQRSYSAELRFDL